MADNQNLPGRLGYPNMDLEHDPRIHPAVLAALTTLGLGKNVTSSPMSNPSLAELEPIMASSHAGFSAAYEGLPNDLPSDASEPEVTQREITITSSPDNNPVTLHVFRRADIPLTQPIPGIVYTHGGGMTVLNTINKVHVRWCQSLAQSGVTAILVDFRNAWTPEGRHNPFPAGLNDCASAARWVCAHRAEVGVGKVVVQGESGGGNLALATGLKARREGWAGELAGVHATIPFISGGYGWSAARKRAELPSLLECDGYFLDTGMMEGMATYYTPTPGGRVDPLAWPYHAAPEDLVGLPPHVLSMDELDPLRDEGMAYARKLAAAGVEVAAEVNMGGVHGTSLIFRQARPAVYRKAISQVAAFALGL